MAGIYTKAQHKATQAYRSKMASINITITPQEKATIKTLADKKRLSVKQYLMELVNNDLKKEGI